MALNKQTLDHQTLSQFLYSNSDLTDETFFRDSLAQQLNNFYTDVFSASPISDNTGGMGLEAAFFLFSTLLKIKPETIIESGVWKGFTTFLFDQVPECRKLYCFDPAVEYKNFIQYKSIKAHYFAIDWATPMFSKINSSNTVAFFDDHQDQLERICLSYQRGIRFVVIDDNYYLGGGGHNSLMDHLRSGNDILKSMIDKIYVSEPLLRTDREFKPLLTLSDLERYPSLASHISASDCYKWLTLVQLRDTTLKSKTQSQDISYIEEKFSKVPL